MYRHYKLDLILTKSCLFANTRITLCLIKGSSIMCCKISGKKPFRRPCYLSIILSFYDNNAVIFHDPVVYLPCLSYLEFASCFRNSFSITTVDYIDESVCIIKIVPPQGAEFLLTTYIPDCEDYVLVLDLFNIESYSWNSR